MRSVYMLGLLALAAFVGSPACSSSSGSASPACIPGASVACVGPGGCSGNQVCKSDGSGFDSCSCASVSDGGSDTTTATDSASGSDSGSSGDTTVGADTGTPTDSSAGTDTGPSSDGGGWSPSDLTGLVVWLDDTRGIIPDPSVGGGVARWLDQSGHGNDANPINTGPATANFTLDAAVINGHDAVKCGMDGTWLSITDSADVQFGTGDFALIVVARYEGDANFIHKLDPTGGSDGWLLDVKTGVYRLDTPSGSAVVAETSSSKFHILVGRGAALQLMADGASGSGPTSTTNIDFAGTDVKICDQGTIGTLYEIAELLVVKGTLSDTDLTNVTTYLKSKFKL